MNMVVTIIAHVFTKIYDAMQHIWAWFAAIGIFIANIFAGHAFIVNLVAAVTVMDAVWGISVRIKEGKFFRSELLRLTIGKFAVYGCALFGFAGLDNYICAQTGMEMTITTAVIGVLIVLAELWSSCASMLILFPDFPFLRLLQKALTGEIALACFKRGECFAEKYPFEHSEFVKAELMLELIDNEIEVLKREASDFVK